MKKVILILIFIFLIGFVCSEDFELRLCEDQACTQTGDSFELGSSVFIDYIGSYEEVYALVVFPDESEIELTLPDSVNLTQAGNYDLGVIAFNDENKEDYETFEQNFSVFGEIDNHVSSTENKNISSVNETGEIKDSQSIIKRLNLELEKIEFLKELKLKLKSNDTDFVIFIAVILLVLCYLIIKLISTMVHRRSYV